MWTGPQVHLLLLSPDHSALPNPFDVPVALSTMTDSTLSPREIPLLPIAPSNLNTVPTWQICLPGAQNQTGREWKRGGVVWANLQRVKGRDFENGLV